MKQRGMSFGGQGNTMTVKFCLSEKDAADDGKARWVAADCGAVK